MTGLDNQGFTLEPEQAALAMAQDTMRKRLKSILEWKLKKWSKNSADAVSKAAMEMWEIDYAGQDLREQDLGRIVEDAVELWKLDREASRLAAAGVFSAQRLQDQ